MTDYSKWKVTDLKAELKRRGIAQTGLRVKQQFIDKLLEAEAGDQAGESKEGASAGPKTTDAQGTAEQQPAEQPTPDVPQDVKPEEQKTEEPKPDQAQEPLAQNGDVEKRDEPKPAEPTAEETPRDEAEVDQPMTDAAEQVRQEEKPQEQEQADPGKEAEKTLEEVPAPQAGPDEAAAQPVEQAPGDAMAQEALSEQREPAGAEPAAPTDGNTPSAKAPEAGNELPPALPTEEVAEDRLKRKRRSQSPIATTEALASKKAKAQDETPRVVLPEDQEGLATEEQLVKEQVQQQEAREGHGAPAPAPEESRPRKEVPPKQDARFKALFAGAEREQVRPASPPADTEMKDAEVEPALHAATAALYIGGLMRPLQPGMLRNHLVTLASAPGSSPSEDVIVDFHLDHIKTHCFASFTNVSAASRVRSALHRSIWPNERNRKNLFVDFIPEQKLQQWINTEEESRRRGGPQPRWEVRYDRTGDGVEAVLDEIDPKGVAGNPPPRSRQESMTDGPRVPPSGPRADRERLPSGPSRAPPPAEPRPSRPGQGFKPLDELFKSTTVKPKLYYLPVTRETADRRLDRFDDLLRKGDYPRRGGDETRRISFEDGDLFVDNGPEFAGGGGGGGGGGSRRRRGRGRGGFGDSWRG
ncbi:SAP domain protein [Aspergillus ruber CBS 135680]|uniref:SAP domain-containing protein n=1 Tax=Aspergillus ruber (strain CBS 135680) TaxID=1388766 RepID=A0A017S9I8_ASPRC|nr:uncharacterized protein EURHEDRAFT_153294 [Aspergillus ruber CBS 135680]EYE93572.1 hypothetical protein EURHEDRAFT_153294 [Aspergillus ruber CBS 135680]